MLVVTGATGRLGRIVVERLLERVPADRIAVVVRDRERAAGLAGRGVTVRIADYNEPGTLARAFAPGDRALLISGNDLERNVAQHSAVVAAARTAGVASLAYTGILSTAAGFALVDMHRATEREIEASGLPYTFLRNGWYTENYTVRLPQVLAEGVLVGNAGPGDRIATATREDYALAAAVVMADLEQDPDGAGAAHLDRAYDLSGDTAWSFAEFAAEAGRQAGTPVRYEQLTAAAYRDVLTGAGVPEPMARLFTDTDDSIARGELARTTGDLSRLTGRPTTPLAETVEQAVAAVRARAAAR
ncbi:SDR family oxidoreductase [Actinacidiphila alni]|uniref:SDR family oxidoreductase n=1 Tax=Actinacidiphila alni TaxID=380248 RepID=UPI0033F0D13C